MPLPTSAPASCNWATGNIASWCCRQPAADQGFDIARGRGGRTGQVREQRQLSVEDRRERSSRKRRARSIGNHLADERISELARRSGVATTALRYYQKAGLLPKSARTRSGYRDYDGTTVPRLAFIRAAQAIGLRMAEIREVIGIRDGGTSPCAHVLELIEHHRAELRARIRQLQQLESELSVLAKQGSKVDPADCDPAGICKVIPAELSTVSSPTRASPRPNGQAASAGRSI